jgi:hypothetical protein
MKVIVATYEHRHGQDVRVFKTGEGASRWRQEIVRLWFHEACAESKPGNDEEAADVYFSTMGERDKGEWFTTEEHEVEE